MLSVQLIFLALVAAAAAQVVPLAGVNTPGDERAIAVRVDSTGTELWVTTQPATEPLARQLAVFRYRAGDATAIGFAPAPINLASTAQQSARNGCAAFALCSPSYGVFVSNRRSNGLDYDNDLYHMQWDGIRWNVRRLDVLSSEWWDDTPALSPDGRLLFFASNRDGHERGTTDLFVSRWLDTGWSVPTKLAISTERWSEQSPYASTDGYLYYATDQSGDFDIWRVRYDPVTGQTIGQAEPLPFAGVNQRGTHEGSPAFAGGGNVFLFSSNRTARGDFDIYLLSLANHTTEHVTIRVVVRTRVIDRLTGVAEDSIAVYPKRPVHVRVLPGGKETIVLTDSSGIVHLPLPEAPRQQWLIYAEVHSPRYVSSRDTLELSSICRELPVHTLVVWDTAALVSPECVQDFPVKNVRFFVTGYWCPTTQRYAPWLACTPIVTLDTCGVVYYQQPQLACTDNEIFHYRLVFTPPRVEFHRRDGSACIDLAEAKSKGPQFAREVDAAIERIISSMSSALQAPCVQRAIADGKTVTVTVTGWTDPRPLDPTCSYTGPTINVQRGIVRMDTKDSPYVVADSLPGSGRIPFVRSKAGGNYLLSQLRAYYTALLLDRLWEEQLPTYAALKASGQIDVIAVGKAISQENRDYSERRSIEVRVSVPMPERKVMAGSISSAGSYVKLCQLQCVQH